VEPGLAPRIADEMVSLIDLVPTILARFRLVPIHHVDGRDLTPVLEGWWRPWRERPLFSEAIYTDAAEGPLRWRITTRAGVLIDTPEPTIQRGKFPLRPSAVHELYLPSDAAEVENRAGADAELEGTLVAELDRHRRIADLLQGPMPPWSSLAPDLVKQLRALGYVQ
jgi:arylsulfatase A-like enzyme